MDIKNLKLDDKDLGLVAGGSYDNSSVTIIVPIQCSMSEDVEIKVYVDGVYDQSKTTIVSGISSKAFTFCGSGTSEVKFKLNDDAQMIYIIEFNNGTYFQI